MKKKKLLSIIATAIIVLIIGCEKDNYIETLGLCPTVISTTPINTATNVPINQVITATFNKEMNPETITETSFTIEGTSPITGTITYEDSTASFTPTNNLSTNTTYVVKISTAVKDLNGNALQQDYIWTFSTGTTLFPLIIVTSPTNNQMNVSLNKIVSANFNMPMDSFTINTTTFTLKQGNTIISGIVNYNGTTALFTPTSLLVPNTQYTATITIGAKNLAGVGLQNNYIWKFTTGITNVPEVISTDPLNNATGVALNKTADASFNMQMDPLTVNGTTFTLKQGATNIPGVVSYTSITASFNPSADLSSNTTYTARITTGAKNLAGIGLATDYVWTFTTLSNISAPNVDLGTVGRFGIIAGVGVSNNAGFSEIHNMDVGISPGVRSSITGFPPAIVVNGAIYASDDVVPVGVAAMLILAKQDLTNAYLFAEGATLPAPATVSGDIGGTTLAPGIYKTNSTLLIQSGNVTLDAQGDANAVWIFQIASSLTTIGGAGGNVILSGGAQAKNVFWQVGSSATIGDFTSFKGNVMALTSITMNSGATAVGRMLARNGSVVMTSTNIIDKP